MEKEINWEKVKEIFAVNLQTAVNMVTIIKVEPYHLNKNGHKFAASTK